MLMAEWRKLATKTALAAALALLATPALAQIGAAPTTILAGLADYAPRADGAEYLTGSGFRFHVTAVDGVATEVGGSGALTDANVRFLGALVGAASGYGAGIAAPVADFFRTRAAELEGRGEVAIEVMEYLMFVVVTPAAADAPGAPGVVEVRFAPQFVADERFGPPAHALGPADAAHVIRLFTDLQCPFCAQFESQGMPIVLDELLPRGDVRFELHHFPLKSIHPNAIAAAEASECVAAAAAATGGRDAGERAFWDYQAALFAAQPSWADLPDPLPAFAAVAAELELDGSGLAACVRSGEFGPLVEESYRVAAVELRLTGTPTLFVDGLKVADYRDLDEYLRLMRLGDAIRLGAGAPAASGAAEAAAPAQDASTSGAPAKGAPAQGADAPAPSEPDAPSQDADAPDAPTQTAPPQGAP